MKNFTLISLLITIVIPITMAQPSLQWAKRFNGPIAADKGNAITVDASYNVYVTGSSDGVGVGSDCLTIKYNSNGDTLWAKRYNGSANGIDEAVAIKVDGAGNVYITGKSQGTGSDFNIITIKYNASGIQQWASVFNKDSNINDIGYNLVVEEATGNVYVVGASGWNSIVIKYNASGIQQWNKINVAFYNPIDTETEYFIDINNFNNVIMVIDEPDADGNYIILELNPLNGNVVYQYNIPFVQVFLGTPKAMVLDGNGNMYVISTGYSASNIPIRVYTAKFTHSISTATWVSYRFSTGSARITGVDAKLDANLNTFVLYNFYNGSNYNYYVEKYNPIGISQWTKQYNTSPGIDDIPVSLSLNNLNNQEVFVTGYNSTGNITTVGYDNNGNPLWTQVVYDCGNNGADIASSMIMDNCNNLYITGSSNCNGTNKDVKTIKYSTSVTEITPDGAITICQGESVALSTIDCAGCTFFWSSGQTTQNIIVSPSITTNYTVTVTNTMDCSATSLPKTVAVNPITVPSANISASTTSICFGENITFTVAPTNGGVSPIYQWYVNGSLVGGNSPTFSSTMLSNGAQIYCVMTSNASCVNPPTATSNTISVTVNPPLTTSISIDGPSAINCSNQNATFTAIQTNGGAMPTYQWYLNGSPVGTNSATYSTTALTDNAQIYCIMTSNASCASPVMATSNSITISINDLDQPNIVISNDTIYATNYSGVGQYFYNWYFNGNFISTEPYVIFQDAGFYELIINFNGCEISNSIILVGIIDETNKAYINVFPNPSGDYFNIEGFGLISDSYRITLRNVLGQVVIEKDIAVTNGDDFTLQLNARELSSGNYFVTIHSESDRHVFAVQKR